MEGDGAGQVVVPKFVPPTEAGGAGQVVVAKFMPPPEVRIAGVVVVAKFVFESNEPRIQGDVIDIGLLQGSVFDKGSGNLF